MCRVSAEPRDALEEHMTQPLLAALLLACTAVSSASANVVATDGSEARPSIKRVEGRLGILLGGSDVGDADGFSIGVSAGAGYRIGDVTLRALFDHYRVGDSSDETMVRRGRGTRVGGALRYSFLNTGDVERERGGLGVDFWGEVGIGVEHVAWRQGGVFDRPSGEVAVGFELDGQGERNRTGRRRHGGYFMAFRTLIGQGPEMDGPAVCAGPCTKATRPSRTDLSMFFELGLHWGR
jgi:hypothetical protein